MRKIIFVSGGQRSGKSAFAQSLCESMSNNPIYLATARIWDEDFLERVKKHQSARDDRWQTVEEEVALSQLNLVGRTVMLDCVTLWLTNIFHDKQYDKTKALSKAVKEWQDFIQQDMILVVVSNELGMGVHPMEESTRHFADLHGSMNQMIAAAADEAYLLISGISVKIK